VKSVTLSWLCIKLNWINNARRTKMANRSGSQREIAKIAYNLYVQRGMTDGHDLDDWLQAEKIVVGQQAKARGNKTGTILKRTSRSLKKE
jgi:hypothetical protein